MTRRIEVHNAFNCTDLDWSGAMCGGTTMHSSPKLSLLAVRPRFSHAALAHETSLGAKSQATIEMCAAERAMGTRVVACHARGPFQKRADNEPDTASTRCDLDSASICFARAMAMPA